MSDIKVNFTDKEATSEARSFEVLPTGEYHVAITKMELNEVKAGSKNAGKPFWNVEMTIQEGKYENSKCWGTVMLFDGALYSAAQLLKATGFANALETGQIPSGGELEGKKLIVTGQKVKDEYKMKKDGLTEPVYKFEVKGYKAENGTSAESLQTSKAGSSGGASSMLP